MVQRIDYQHEWYEKYKPNYKEHDERLPEYWQMKYVDRAKMIRDISPEANTLLDIGCGLGRAMTYFQALCFDVWGVEPSDFAYENNPLKDRVVNRYFDESIELPTFDVVHIEQVLSHILDWKGTLAKAVKFLNPNGVIVIEEPNDDSFLQNLIDKGKYWITKDHCNYFNLQDNVLSKYLEVLGLKVCKVTSTFPLEFFQLMGIEYLGSDKLGQMIHLMRYNLLKDMGNKRLEFKESMAKLGWGRDLIILAQKS